MPVRRISVYALTRVALDILLLLLGGGALYWGAEWLVEGASQIAQALGVPPLLVGLTVVAYGTSAPEMAVSVTAALDGQSGLSLGNVIGSNIANVGLVLGLTALIAPPLVPAGLLRRELPWLCGATAATVFALADGLISRLEGALLFGGAAVFTGVLVRSLRKTRRAEASSSAADEGRPPGLRWKLIALTLVGLITLPVGGSIFVTGAMGIARSLGIGETMIGMTVVAFGTSLPELSASIVAALRGHSELAVGNVVGSNLFNLLLVLGATAVIHPLVGSLGALNIELIGLGIFTLLGAVMMHRVRQISRVEGGLLVAGYGALILALITRT